jgi:hypothetical protein
MSKDQISDTTGKLVGMVRICRIETIRSQVLNVARCMDAVHRLNGSGLFSINGLRYSRSPLRRVSIIGSFDY